MSKRNTQNLRTISWFLAVVMLMPFMTTAAEAAVVTFLSPQPGQASTGRYVEVAVSFNTQSDLGITRLELWIDGNLYSKKVLTKPESRGVCSFQWDTAGFINGVHFLLVKMFAGDREIASISGSGTVGNSNSDVIPPVVAFANIKEGGVLKGVQNIKLTAMDNSGEYPLVSLLVDQKLRMLKNTPPYIYSLDTTAYEDGTHEIQAYAFDAEGNKSDVVTIEVQFANGNMAVASAPEQPVEQKTNTALTKATSPSAAAIVPKAVVTTGDTAARATAPISTEALSGNQANVAVAPAKVETKPAAAVAKPEPKPSATVAVAPAKVETKPVAAAAQPEPKPAATVAVAPAKVESKPAAPAPVVMAKIETPKLPEAKVSEFYKNITATRAPAKIRSEQPLVITTAPVSAPALPAAAKPAPKQVQQAPAKPVPAPAVKVAKAPATPVAKPAATADVKVVAVSKNTSKIKENQQRIASKMIAPDQPLAVVETTVPAPKAAISGAAAKVALAPKPQTAPAKQSASVTPTKASYDVVAFEVPKNNKIKIRDVVNALDGVVLWDSKTRTVTAYIDSIKLELRIGKGLVKVNGKQMKVNLVPYISKGRTVIDIRLLEKAYTVAGEKMPLDTAKNKK